MKTKRLNCYSQWSKAAAKRKKDLADYFSKTKAKNKDSKIV